MSAQECWFHHDGLSVTDLDASVDLYERILGFRCQGRFHNPNITTHTAMLRKGDINVELLCVPVATCDG